MRLDYESSATPRPILPSASSARYTTHHTLVSRVTWAIRVTSTGSFGLPKRVRQGIPEETAVMFFCLITVDWL